MRILYATANQVGSYGNPQDWEGETPPDGYVQIADGTDETPLTGNGGFATLTLTDGIITGFTPDMAAWEVWKVAHPEQPAQPDTIQLALAELAETESAHDIENKLALAELAETIGGTTNG